MDMEYIPGWTETDIKESLGSVWNMVKVSKNLQTEISIKVYIQMVNHVDLENITGQMEAILKDYSKMG